MSSPMWPTTDTDVVSFSALHLAATVGPDGWHRTRPQPISLTVHLHLSPTFLDTPGRSDDVADSLHYGDLAKAVESHVNAQTTQGAGYTSVRALAEDVTEAAFVFVDDATTAKRTQDADADAESSSPVTLEKTLHAVRVVVALPKHILLAEGFELDLVTRTSDWVPSESGGSEQETATTGTRARSRPGAIVRVMNLSLPVFIGVNPPEWVAKQRVITHITFFEAARTNTERPGTEGPGAGSAGEVVAEEIDYPVVIKGIATDIQDSSYLTLEKLVYKIIRMAYSATTSESNAPKIEAITVRCQKPSALPFADASQVEMTRKREAIFRQVQK